MSNRISCNQKVLHKTVVNTGESEALIKQVIGHHTTLIAEIMQSGTMESIRVIEFGIFKSMPKRVYWTQKNKAKPKTSVRKPDNDETI